MEGMGEGVRAREEAYLDGSKLEGVTAGLALNGHQRLAPRNNNSTLGVRSEEKNGRREE